MVEIIVVDDNPDHRTILKHRLKEMFEYSRIVDFESAGSCLSFIDNLNKSPDMIVADLSLQDTLDGADLFFELQKRKILSKFILVSSDSEKLSKRSNLLRIQDRYFLKDHFFNSNINDLKEKIECL